ncbi:hypothetical protein Bbelb_280550 [Branchiostoma belcheri]|nr:hypothetical protein Bbelb_280550 [Branchiostoma belcheri]
MKSARPAPVVFPGEYNYSLFSPNLAWSPVYRDWDGSTDRPVPPGRGVTPVITEFDTPGDPRAKPTREPCRVGRGRASAAPKKTHPTAIHWTPGYRRRFLSSPFFDVAAKLPHLLPGGYGVVFVGVGSRRCMPGRQCGMGTVAGSGAARIRTTDTRDKNAQAPL